MKHMTILLFPLAALAACGGEQEIPVTNSGNVILNDDQANYAFENDEPINTLANDSADLEALETNGVDVANSVDLTTPQPANGM